MGVDSLLAQHQPTRDHDLFQSSSEGDCATLILDAMGHILSCGIAAGKLFGGKLTDYPGKPISTYISNFIQSDNSQSYSARYFAHLCADSGWRRFAAVDVHGVVFPVELNLSLIESSEQGVFLLSVRRPKASE